MAASLSRASLNAPSARAPIRCGLEGLPINCSVASSQACRDAGITGEVALWSKYVNRINLSMEKNHCFSCSQNMSVCRHVNSPWLGIRTRLQASFCNRYAAGAVTNDGNQPAKDFALQASAFRDTSAGGVSLQPFALLDRAEGRRA